jgi:hypothetical protein
MISLESTNVNTKQTVLTFLYLLSSSFLTFPAFGDTVIRCMDNATGNEIDSWVERTQLVLAGDNVKNGFIAIATYIPKRPDLGGEPRQEILASGLRCRIEQIPVTPGSLELKLKQVDCLKIVSDTEKTRLVIAPSSTVSDRMEVYLIASHKRSEKWVDSPKPIGGLFDGCLVQTTPAKPTAR